MSPEQQRIAIAEACGWHQPLSAEAMKWKEGWTMPEVWWLCPEGVLRMQSDLPDYLSDLNAMHEAEVSLSRWQKVEYCKKLSLVILSDAEGKGTSTHQLVMATAAQRAEAFLKTLNLWENNE